MRLTTACVKLPGCVVPFLAWLVLAMSSPAAAAGAQSFETVGTRAQGMGGAFVGVADDASAVYWNPAGLGGWRVFQPVSTGTPPARCRTAGPPGAVRTAASR